MSRRLIDLDKLYSTGKDKYGYFVEFEEGVWENAEFTDYVGGYPIYAKRIV